MDSVSVCVCGGVWLSFERFQITIMVLSFTKVPEWAQLSDESYCHFTGLIMRSWDESRDRRTKEWTHFTILDDNINVKVKEGKKNIKVNEYLWRPTVKAVLFWTGTDWPGEDSKVLRRLAFNEYSLFIVPKTICLMLCFSLHA